MTDENLIELLTLSNDLLVTANDRLAKIEQHLAALRGAGAGPLPAPAPSQPPQGFAPLNTWVCPIHGVSKTVPAGVSQRTGKAYTAFVACAERGCDEKPPRAAAPQRAVPPSMGGQMP